MGLIPKDDPLQALRMRRYFIGVSAYLMWLILIIYCYFLGFVRLPLQGIAAAFSVVIGILLGFYIVFRTGWNQKFSDPSLTFAQMTPGAIGAMFAIYFTDRVRAVMLLIYVVTLLFGILRFNLKQFVLFTLFSVSGYGLVIVLLYTYHPETIHFRIEALQFVVFATVLVWFSMVGTYISSLRNRISATNNELSNALHTIETLAIHDDLTQAYNRRQMFSELRRGKSLADRHGQPFSIAIFDLDDFKHVNDTYGHLKGDEVLKRLIRQIGHELRQSDSLARYGGEEFMVMMADTDIAGARECGEKIRQCAQNLRYPGFPDAFKITASVGVTAYNSIESIDYTILRADTALYRAKANGKNRVEIETARPELEKTN
ncbi:MAG: GGDEF domain-containing protein [Thermodesulfobacteriota bacterium]